MWEPSTGKVLQRLACGVCNGVSALAFSPDGSLLMVSLQDEQHQMLLFDWRKGFLKARVNGGQRKVLCLAFSLCPSPPPGDDAPPPPPPDVAAALARASLFPPTNPLAPPLNLPVRVLQAGVGHFSLLELKAPVVGVLGAATVSQVSFQSFFPSSCFFSYSCFCSCSCSPLSFTSVYLLTPLPLPPSLTSWSLRVVVCCPREQGPTVLMLKRSTCYAVPPYPSQKREETSL